MLMGRFSGRSLGIVAIATALSVSSFLTAQDTPKQVDALERQAPQYLQEQKPRQAIPVLRRFLRSIRRM
jgi:hypothetical protein